MPIPLPYIIGTVSAVITGYLWNKKKAKKVFISYHSKADSHYKNLIVAWSNNDKFQLKVEDFSTDVGIKSNDVSYMRRRMKEQISKADYFIIFIGEKTHQREWVEWEIEQAKLMKKNIVAIKENRAHKSPKSLLGSGATWIYRFTEQGLRKALEA
jgi:hypothetical protein